MTPNPVSADELLEIAEFLDSGSDPRIGRYAKAATALRELATLRQGRQGVIDANFVAHRYLDFVMSTGSEAQAIHVESLQKAIDEAVAPLLAQGKEAQAVVPVGLLPVAQANLYLFRADGETIADFNRAGKDTTRVQREQYLDYVVDRLNAPSAPSAIPAGQDVTCHCDCAGAACARKNLEAALSAQPVAKDQSQKEVT